MSSSSLPPTDEVYSRTPAPGSLPPPGSYDGRAFYSRQNCNVTSLDHSPSGSSATLVSDDEFDEFNSFRPTKCEDFNLFGIFKPEANELPPFVPDIQLEFEMCTSMSEHSQGFLEEFRQRKRYTNIPPDVSDLLAITDFPIYRRATPLRPPASENVFSAPPLRSFNPNATPFVPTAINPSTQVHQPENRTPGLTNPTWFSVFWAGACATDAQYHQSQASILVTGNKWTVETLAELAQHFCWKGGEGDSLHSRQVASFARVVYATFRESGEEWSSSCFMFNLQECVVGTFKACWKSDQPQAINLHHTPSSAYLASALCLAAFIGDLFNQDLLPATIPYNCLSLLLSELVSIEHIHAIHTLLLHANEKLWRSKNGNRAIKNFVTSLTQRTSTLPDTASVMHATLDKNEVHRCVSEIVEMVHRWRGHPNATRDAGLVPGTKLLAVGLDMAKRR